MERCSKCVIPDTYPGIQIDSDGVCSFCTEAPEPKAPQCPGNPDQLLALIAQHRLPGSQYDCALALSGGRDSTYALYYVVRVLGLRVLAYTVDHGLLPDHTRDNIRNAVRILNVAHVMEPIDAMERCTRAMLSAWLHRPSAPTVSLLCLGCRQALYAAILEGARRHGTPIVICGVGEAGVHGYLPIRFFSPEQTGWKAHLKVTAGFGLEFLRNPRYLASPHIVRMMLREYVSVVSRRWLKKKSAGVKYVPLYDYIPWDEDTILRTIQSELGWQAAPGVQATWRSDCKLAMLKNQFYLLTAGFTLQDSLVGDLVRTGRITRAEGLERLARENVVNPNLIEEALDDIGVPAPERFQKSLRNRAAA